MVGRCDVLAIGAHPDDVELGCGATIALLVGAGKAVGVVDLTAGELATRGDVATRRDEATAAVRALGAAWRVCLQLPDGGLDVGSDAQMRAVVGVMRQAQPRVVFLPHPNDPHPDHLAASAIVRRAAFLAGVARCLPENGPAHRPRMLLAYPGPRQVLPPDLVVDVTRTYASKRAALASYASQFTPDVDVPTHLASGHYLAAIEGRDRAYGNAIEAQLGEAFAAIGPLAASEVAWLIAGAR